MSDMSPDTKALLDAARDGDDPTRAEDARTRRALVAKLDTDRSQRSASRFVAGAQDDM